VFYLGKRSASQDHEASVSLLEELDMHRNDLKKAVSHLTELLKVKNLAEYEERLLGRRDSEQAMKHLGRFKTWARGKLPRVEA